MSLTFKLAACLAASLFVSGLPSLALAASTSLAGEYATARTADDEVIQVNLLKGGKARLISEHNFLIPGDGARRRGRTTSFGKWTQKGDTVRLSYGHVVDRLRFNGKTPLDSIGLPGSAPALALVAPVDANSRLKGAILWKAPHRYKLKGQVEEAAPLSNPRGAVEPAK